MSILNEITPIRKERKELKNKVKSFLKLLKNNEGIKFVVGGSYAKGTYLKGSLDIDVFAKFDYTENKYVDISKKLRKFLKSKFKKISIVHGSRDYYHIEYEGLKFEIIPVLKIKKSSQAVNITDISPLHVKYVRRRIIGRRDDVRLLKQFCKANDLYGAESHIKGFSGYVLELLIIYYRSFENLIKKAKEWDDLEVIHFGMHKEKALNSLSKSKKKGPLIIIDPVQENRNAAAALSKKSYDKFISLCKTYNGNKTFFIKEEILLKKLKNYVIFEIKPYDGKRDIVGAKLLSLLERIKKEIERYGFKIKNYGWKFEDEIFFWFKADKLDKNKIHFGPKVKDKAHAVHFKKKWNNRVKVQKGKLYVVLKRKYTDLLEYCKYISKEKWFKERVKKVKVFKQG